jgi:hypothetical protein
VPDGIEGIVPFAGPPGDVAYHLVGGMRPGIANEALNNQRS